MSNSAVPFYPHSCACSGLLPVPLGPLSRLRGGDTVWGGAATPEQQAGQYWAPKAATNPQFEFGQLRRTSPDFRAFLLDVNGCR